MNINKYTKNQKEQIINFLRAEGVKIIVPLLEEETEKQTMFIKNDVLHINLKNGDKKIINLNMEAGADIYKNLDLLPFNILKFYSKNIKLDFNKINKNVIPILPNLHITKSKTGKNLTFESFASIFLMTSYDIPSSKKIFLNDDYLYKSEYIMLYEGYYWNDIIKSSKLWYSSFWGNTDGWGVLEVKKWFASGANWLKRTYNIVSYYTTNVFLGSINFDYSKALSIEPQFKGEINNKMLDVLTLIKVKNPKQYMLNMITDVLKNYTNRVIKLLTKKSTLWFLKNHNITAYALEKQINDWVDAMYTYINQYPSLKSLSKNEIYEKIKDDLKKIKTLID